MSKLLKYLFFLFTLLFCGISTAWAVGPTTWNTDVTTNTTWTVADSPYIISSFITVQPNATLTIQPGVQIKFDPYGGVFGLGPIISTGNSNNIILFTSNSSNPQMGDWYGVVLLNQASSFSFSKIEYSTFGLDLEENINLSDNIFSDNYDGLFLAGNVLGSIANNSFLNNDSAVKILFDTNYNPISPNPNINNNYFSNNFYNVELWGYGNNSINGTNNWWGTLDPVFIVEKIFDHMDDWSLPSINFSPYLDAPNGASVLLSGNYYFGTITTNTVWNNTNTPYIVLGSIDIDQNVSLTINPGVTVKFTRYAGIIDGWGSLNIQGTSNNPVTFTSYYNSPQQDDWEGVIFYNPQSLINHTIIEYAHNAFVYDIYNNSNITIQNLILRNSNQGLIVNNYLSPLVSISNNSIISNNYGMLLFNSSPPNYIISNNTINNIIENITAYSNPPYSTINAENNWWGTIDPAAILAKINFALLLPNSLNVDFNPVLNGQGGTSTNLSYTLINSAISGNTTWSPVNNPYIVSGLVGMQPNSFLLINAGTEIKMLPGSYLEFNSTVIANGAVNSLIRFSSALLNPSLEDWYGLGATGTNLVLMNYVIVEDSQIGLSTDNSLLSISNSSFLNNDIGLSLGSGSTNAAVHNSTFTNNNIGVVVSGLAHMYPQPDFSQNNIFNNLEYNFWANGGAPVDSITIANNWWGDTNLTTIEQTIYDHTFNSSLPTVNITPILNSGAGSGPAPVLGGTTNIPGGSLTQINTTWDLAGSPYIIQGNVTVPQNYTLNIMPGVQIKFAGNYTLTVNGTLNASGSAGSLIRFTSNQPSPAIGDWGHIKFNSTSSSSILDYVLLEYSNLGINIENTSPQIQHCTLRNNNRGINLIGSTNSLINNNTIINNSFGIYLNGSGFLYPNPSINNNSIFNNSNYNLFASTSLTGTEVNAQNNWWGNTNVLTIFSKIYDLASNQYSPRVNFSPFLDGNGGVIQQTLLYGTYGVYQGFVTTNWNQTQNPYIVVGNISIPYTCQLNIAAGVTIKFNGNYGITNNGLINFNGTLTNPVVLTSNFNYPSTGDWAGITSNYAINANYTTIEYANNAFLINVATTPQTSIQNSLIRLNNVGISFQFNALGTTFVQNNQIINNLTSGISITGNSSSFPSPVITNNFINNYSYNIYTDILTPSITSDNTVNAMNNWWGTTDVNTIKLKIRDKIDSANLPTVRFTPFYDSLGGNLIGYQYLYGVYSSPTFLMTNYSPFIMIGTVTILSGSYMTIDPGVEIRSDGNYGFNALGNLYSIGQLGNQIKFTSTSSNPAPNSWKGVSILGTFNSPNNSSVISHTIIEYADKAIYLYNSSASVDNNIIRNSNTAIFCESRCNSLISSNELHDNGTAITLLGSYSAPVNLQYPNPIINNNSFYNNAVNNIYLSLYPGPNNAESLIINAENNWWDTISPPIIANKIWDNSDNPSLPSVDYTPFSNLSTSTISNVYASPKFIDLTFNETSAINYTLNSAGNITIKIFEFQTNNLIRTLINSAPRSIGLNSEIWNGLNDLGQIPTNNSIFYYTIQITDSLGQISTYAPSYLPGPVTITNTTPITPTTFNPFKGETLPISYYLSAPALVTLKIGEIQNALPAPTPYKTLLNNEPRDSLVNTETWDGGTDWGTIAINPIGNVTFNSLAWTYTTLLPENIIVLTHKLKISELKANPYSIFPLYGNYSNIEYSINHDAFVTISISSITSPIYTRVLQSSILTTAGDHSVIWDGKDSTGKIMLPTNSNIGYYSVVVTATDPTTSYQTTRICPIIINK